MKLCPTSRSLVFVLLFQRGLLFIGGAGEGRRAGTRELGVGAREEFPWLRVGDVTVLEAADRGIEDFRVETGWGRLE